MRYIESINYSLRQILENNPHVYLLGEDILDPYGGAFKATRGLSSDYPDRIMTTPICEASLAGVAIGMALRGLHPIVEIMFGDFITLCIDQIVNHACKYPAMYNEKLKVPLIIRTPMGGGRGYGPTHSQSLEKLLLGTPFLDIVAPSHFHDPGILLQHSVERGCPVLFIENKLLYPQQLILSDNYGLTRVVYSKCSYGYGDVLVSNCEDLEPDVTIITYGGLSRLLAKVMRNTIEEEIRLLCIFVGCLSPLSPATFDLIINNSLETKKILLIEEGSTEFGWTAEISAALFEKIRDSADVVTKRLGAMNTIIPAAISLENKVLVSEKSIENAIKELILL